MRVVQRIAAAALLLFAVRGVVPASAQHEHSVPEKLGKVIFPVSCARGVQGSFNHAVALIHSFGYAAAREEFAAIAKRDPQCAMAHWGVALSYYHQLWDPAISPADLEAGAFEIQSAEKLAETASEREQAFIQPLAVFYRTAASASIRRGSLAYTNAMRDVAMQNSDDAEPQVFYALALLSVSSPVDAAHTNQKVAAQILEPLFQRYPDHPGLAHYLIHAYDHPDLAQQGLRAARAYSKIAPSAPHALHMPSHIFTLLGLWRDSIRSNVAARAAAQRQGDIGEELHAMDYLMYAYLQAGRFEDAAKLLAELRSMPNESSSDFKVAYASTIMPVRLAMERRQWGEAIGLVADSQVPPQFRAITEWGNSVAAARLAEIPEAEQHISNLRELLEEVRKAGDDYWAQQVQIQALQAEGWLAQAYSKTKEALSSLRKAADMEDELAKRPITPGPAVPAREQLADLLLETNQPGDALREYELTLKRSPGRRNALAGAARAAELSGDSARAANFTAQLKALH